MASQASLLKPPLAARNSAAHHGAIPGPLGLLSGIVTHPAAAFRRLREAETGHSYGWFVIIINIVALTLAASASASSMMQRMTGAAGITSILSTIGLSLAGSLVLMLADLLLRTLVVSGMSLILGGKATFVQSFRMSLWTSIPFVIRSIVQSAVMFATGGQSVTGLAGALTTAEAQAAPILSAILGAIDFYMFWSAILLAIGTAVTASIGKGKGITTMLVYLLVALGGILAFQAAGSALSSMLSSTLGSSINLPGVNTSGGGPAGSGGQSGPPSGGGPGQ